MRATADAPVVIVGGGPVGLVCALTLAGEGVAVVVLESTSVDVASEWRGSTLHPPTLEMLDRIGMASTAVADGVRVDRLQYRDLELDRVAQFDYSALDGMTRYPFRVQYEQYKLLRALRGAASDNPNVDVRFGHDVLAVEFDDGRATVVVDRGDSTSSRIVTSWLVGADGAHSVVRKAARIDFVGETYPTLSLVAATRFDLAAGIIDHGFPLGPVSYWTGPAGRVSLIRTPDTWRVALSTDASSGQGPSGVNGLQQPHPRLSVALDRLVGDHRWAETPLGQHELYRSHQRVAARFRHDRALLVGDAAHLSSTTGGMGLNSGVHDAVDLALRLSAPLRAGDTSAAERAAAEYASHRRAIATQIVQPVTRSVRAAVDATDPAVRTARLDELCRDAADPDRAVRHLRDVSMLDAVERVAAS